MACGSDSEVSASGSRDAAIVALNKTFAEAMRQCGPFEPRPSVAVAVSGGADSMALALLAREWVGHCQGTLHAFVVDHGLRTESADEARTTLNRLAVLSIPATLLCLTGLYRGPAVAERARIMRYRALFEACRASGYMHLLLGHHAADQAETLMMRVLGNSLSDGLAAMPAVTETPLVRLLRPLLATDPANLRLFLRKLDVGWVEDPSNQDLHALRPRLRKRAASHLSMETLHRLALVARGSGLARARRESATGDELAQRVTIRPEGFALLSPGRIAPEALASLIRTIGGAAYSPSLSQITSLAGEPRPATVGGVRLLQAGRLGSGLLLVREEAAIEDPVPAIPGAIWDGRFRLVAHGGGIAPGPIAIGPSPISAPSPDAEIGKLGDDAGRFRGHTTLPSAILRCLPAIRCTKALVVVPHLHYIVDQSWAGTTIVFEPRRPMAGSCFMPISFLMMGGSHPARLE